MLTFEKNLECILILNMLVHFVYITPNGLFCRNADQCPKNSEIENYCSCKCEKALNKWVIKDIYCTGFTRKTLRNSFKWGKGSESTISITSMELTHNSFSEISLKDLKNLKELKKLKISHSNLTVIANNAFNNFDALETLDLSDNNLSGIKQKWFQEQRHLTTLNISRNNLAFIEKESFKKLQNLQQLDLSRNNLSTIDKDVFKDLANLVMLNLSDNQLNFLKSGSFNNSPKLSELYLSGNPWMCDPQLDWLSDHVENKTGMMIMDFSSMHCLLPASKKHYSMTKWLSIRSLEREIEKSDLCKNCTCKEERSEWISVNCSSRNWTQLPRKLPIMTRSVHMENNRITSLFLPQNATAYWKTVAFLYLENNSIESLTRMEASKVLKNLVTLHLNKNRLSEIPIHILDQFPNQMDQLHLSDNPWECTCNTVRFMEWLQDHHKQVQDREEVRCQSDGSQLERRVIYRLLKSELCPQNSVTVNYLDIVICIMAVLIIMIVFKLLFDCWRQQRTGKLPRFFSFKLT